MQHSCSWPLPAIEAASHGAGKVPGPHEWTSRAAAGAHPGPSFWLPRRPHPCAAAARERGARVPGGARKGVWHRPACLLARADRRLNQKAAGPRTLLASAPSHSTRREGRGLLREGHDQERLFQGRQAPFWFSVYSPL